MATRSIDIRQTLTSIGALPVDRLEGLYDAVVNRMKALKFAEMAKPPIQDIPLGGSVGTLNTHGVLAYIESCEATKQDRRVLQTMLYILKERAAEAGVTLQTAAEKDAIEAAKRKAEDRQAARQAKAKRRADVQKR